MKGNGKANGGDDGNRTHDLSIELSKSRVESAAHQRQNVLICRTNYMYGMKLFDNLGNEVSITIEIGSAAFVQSVLLEG